MSDHKAKCEICGKEVESGALEKCRSCGKAFCPACRSQATDAGYCRECVAVGGVVKKG